MRFSVKGTTKERPEILHNDFCEPMEAACKSGDLQTVQQLLEQWQPTNNRLPSNIAANPMFQFNKVLSLAIEHDHPSIVRYLFSRGMELSNANIHSALRSRSRPVFDVLINHGLNIDEPGAELWSELDPPLIT